MTLTFLQFIQEDAAEQKTQVGRQIVKQYREKWKGVEGYSDLEKFVEKILKVDPSLKGSYAPWLVRLLIKNPEHNKIEDLERTAKDIKTFDSFKHKMTVKDINQLKTFADLYTAIEPFLPKKGPKTAQEKAAERVEKIKTEGIIDVYSGSEGWIKIPTTKKAAQFISQNTRWCTGAKCNNMFDSYNDRDKLFVIYDKKSQARTQLHIESGSHADVNDKMVGMDSVPHWARSHIVAWYMGHMKKDEIGLKHAIAFAKLGHSDAVKGTDHEEIVDLMKQYGVV